MRAHLRVLPLVAAGALALAPATTVHAEEKDGTFSGFRLPGQQISATDERPPMDPVGGFQLSVMGGVQLRGSASGALGLALGYYKRSTGNVGLELEGALTRGPSGEVYHGLMNLILQSGSRAARMVPYLSIGGGIYHAREKIRDSVAEELPDFGIEPVEEQETGALIAAGFGIRYFLTDGISFRADYREFRALTTGEGGFFDRLFALRRIAGFLSFDL